MKLDEGLNVSSSYCKTNVLMDSLKSTGGLHGEEQRVHEQLKGLLPPSPLGVGIPAEAAQQLGPGSKTGHVVGTDREDHDEHDDHDEPDAGPQHGPMPRTGRL